VQLVSIAGALLAAIILGAPAALADPSGQPDSRYDRATQDRPANGNQPGDTAIGCAPHYEESGTCSGGIQVTVPDRVCPAGFKCQLYEHTGDGQNNAVPSGSCRRAGSRYTAACIKD
jgi:hypothetical protein